MDDTSGRFFVLTGAPGSGKTTLIEALARTGYACSVEAGRPSIKAQLAIGGSALPWREPVAFAELMLSFEIRSHQIAQGERGPVFFDRDVPDVVGYFTLEGVSPPAHVRKAAEIFRSNVRVFVDRRGERSLRRTTNANRISPKPCAPVTRLSEPMDEHGYEIVEAPRTSVEQRVRFILERVPLLRNRDVR
jgi:predicted ATPase